MFSSFRGSWHLFFKEAMKIRLLLGIRRKEVDHRLSIILKLIIIGFDAWAVNGEGLLIHLQYVFVGSNPTQLNNLLIQHEML